MFSEVVRGLPADPFEEALTESRRERGVDYDHDLDEEALRALVARFLGLYEAHTGESFPEDPREQLRQAILAVFDSWNNERAATYRKLNGIPAELGTAVTVQRMVFGNMGEHSGSGVAFTRDPTTGEARPDGDFLLDAQGEDVVAGVRNTETLDGLERRMPEIHAALLDALTALERHYGDIQDVEYTIEDGRLYILQTRNAKRHARAAVRFAVDGHREGLFDRGGGAAQDRPRLARRPHAPGLRPRRRFPRADPRRRGLAGSGEGRDRLQRRGGGGAVGGRGGRDPGPAVHVRRRRRRLPRRPRDPHLPGRQVLARGDRRPRDGQALRVRGQRGADRPRLRRRCGSATWS